MEFRKRSSVVDKSTNKNEKVAYPTHNDNNSPGLTPAATNHGADNNVPRPTTPTMDYGWIYQEPGLHDDSDDKKNERKENVLDKSKDDVKIKIKLTNIFHLIRTVITEYNRARDKPRESTKDENT